jgi:hypothetical protein
MLPLKARWDPLSDAQYTSRACGLESRLDRLLAGAGDHDAASPTSGGSPPACSSTARS